MSVVVSGASDDLIEIEGDVREEFTLHDDDEGDILAFSDGTVLRVCYSADGVWRVSWLAGPIPVVQVAPADDEDNYSDKVTISGDVAWVVHGTELEAT